MRNSSNNIHPDLLAAQKLAYEPSGLMCKKIKKATESQEYGAFEFEINNQSIQFRVAKITQKLVSLSPYGNGLGLALLYLTT